MSVPQNAITRRLSLLTRDWGKFSKNESLHTCIWSVKEDEVNMIEAFYEVEKSEKGKTPDIFLKFSSPYTNHGTYTISLLNELDQIVESSRDQMIEAGVEPDSWTTQKNTTASPDMFLKKLGAFSRLLNIEGNVVAYMSPQKNSDIPGWVDWLMRTFSFQPKQVKVMLVQLEQRPVFEKLIKYPPARCQKKIPDLKMDEAMTELAAKGNPKDPGTKFRKLYVAIMQAAEKSDLPKAENLAKEALAHTRKHGFKMLEATIYMVMGGLYVGHKKGTTALKSYDAAIEVLQKEKKDAELAKQQITVAYLSKGMALFLQKKYDQAALTYESAAKTAVEVSNDFLAMDSYRMAGTCYLKTPLMKNGEDCLKKSLEVGMKLDEKMRRDSTMPFAAMELYEASNNTGKSELDTQMISAIGHDWQELASIKDRNQISSHP